MPESAPEMRAAARFLARYAADLEKGSPATLEEYQAADPRFAHVIAREYAAATAATRAGSDDAHELGGLAVNDRIAEFRIVRLLGSGGQGDVFEAFDERLNRAVALKLLDRRVGPTALRRFSIEVRALAALDHPHISTVYGSGLAEGRPYIAMQLVRGTTLAETMKSSRGATDDLPGKGAVLAAVATIETIARAIHAAHEAGVVHRDLKPTNIMIDVEKGPVILDFGLAGGEISDGNSPTLTGDVMGTPAYMAPEQARGERARIDRRTDIHALGLILFEMVTHRRAFDGANRVVVLDRVASADLPSAQKLNVAVSRDIDTVIARATAKLPEHRFGTALEFADELRRIRMFEPIVSRHLGVAERAARLVRKYPARTATAFLIFVAAAAIANLWIQRKIDAPLAEQRRLEIAAEKRERAIENATQLLASRHYDRAEKELRDLAAVDPDDLETQCLLALATTFGGARDRAETTLSSVERRFAIDPLYLRTKAECLRSDGRSEEADAMENGLGPAKTHVEAFLEGFVAELRGMRLKTKGSVAQLDVAVENYWIALAASARRRLLYFQRLAVVLAELDRPAEVERFKKSVTIAYPDGSGRAMAAMAMTTTDPSAALLAFEAQPIGVRDRTRLYGIALSLNSSGRDEEALRAMRSLVETDPNDATAQSNLASMSWKAGQKEECLKAIRRAVELRPDIAEFRFQHSYFLQESGTDRNRALDEAKAAFEAEKTNPMFAKHYINLLTAADRLEAALTVAETAVKADPKSEALKKIYDKAKRRLDDP